MPAQSRLRLFCLLPLLILAASLVSYGQVNPTVATVDTTESLLHLNEDCESCIRNGTDPQICTALYGADFNSSIYHSASLGRTHFKRTTSFVTGMQKLPKQDFLAPLKPWKLSDMLDQSLASPLMATRDFVLAYHQESLSATTSYSAASLMADPSADAERIMQGGAIRQVLTLDYLADIDDLANVRGSLPTDIDGAMPTGCPGFAVRIWFEADKLPMSGGLYGLPATAPVGYLVFYRAASSGSPASETLGIIHKVKSDASNYKTQSWTHFNDASGNWVSKHFRNFPAGGVELKRTTCTVTSFTNARKYVQTVSHQEAALSSAGTIGSLVETAHDEEEFDDIGGLKRLIRRTRGTNAGTGRSRTTLYGWVNAPSNAAIHGLLEWEYHPDGYFEHHTYNFSPTSMSGSIITRVPWKNTTWTPGSTAPSSIGCLVKTITISAGLISETHRVNGIDLIWAERNSWTASGGMDVHKRESNYGGTASTWLTTNTAYYPDTAGTHLGGRIAWRELADGTAETYAYSTPVSGVYTITAERGAGTGSAVTSGLRTITTVSAKGYGVGETVYRFTGTGSLQMSSWDAETVGTVTDVDFYGRPQGIVHNSNTSDYEERVYGCCGLARVRDRRGIITEYYQDELKRGYKTVVTAGSSVVTVSRSRGPGTSYAGLVTENRETAGSLDVLLSKKWVTTNGEIDKKETSDQDGGGAPELTTYAYSLPGVGETITTVLPDGGKSISETYADRRMHEVSGSAEHHTLYDYAAHTERGGGVVTTVTMPTTASPSGEWEKHYVDLLGRAYAIEYPTKIANGSTFDRASKTYNTHTAAAGSRGKVVTWADEDGVTTSYDYDAEGFLSKTTEIMPNSAGNRVKEFLYSKTTDGTLGPCYTVETKLNGVSVSTKLTGGSGWGNGIIDLGGATRIVLELGGTAGSTIETTTYSDGTRSRRVYIDGRLNSHEYRDNTSGGGGLGVVISSTSYTYDALGRVDTYSDSRTGTTNPGTYTESGNLLNQTDSGGRYTQWAYDAMGRVTAIDGENTLDSAGATINNIGYTSYNADGSVSAKWGDQSCAVSYSYDEQGRMKEMRTYRSLAHNQNPLTQIPVVDAGDPTSWTYHTQRGWLTDKDDAASKGAHYVYTAAGRLKTRTWARGAHTRSDYDQGFLKAVNYFTGAGSDTGSNAGNDSATPDLGYSYDAMGRLTLVTRGGNTHFTYTYSSTDLGVLTEIQNDADHDLRLLTHKRDGYLRPTGYKLGTTSDDDAISEVTYGYDTAGRFSSLTYQRVPGAGSPPAAQTFNYGYNYQLNGSYHEAGGSNSSLMPFSISGPAHTVKRSYETTRDTLHSISNENSALSLQSSYTYTMNALGQRTQVVQAGAAFTSLSGDSADTIGWGYNAEGEVVSANAGRNWDDRKYSYDAIGNRIQSETYNVNLGMWLATTYNADAAATIPGAGALNQYGTIDGPFTPAGHPVYDDDGNLTADDRGWTFGYDGENRLISAIPPSAENWRGKKVYTYDYLGRLCTSAHYNWVGSAWTYSGGSFRYVYNGWNRVESWDTSTNFRSEYIWGLDLSGTLHGAGGVGGMLLWSCSKDYGSSWQSYFPCYDGNGNVGQLLNSSGTVAAHWEYDTFGNTTQSTPFTNWDEPVNWFEFRFSTKPLMHGSLYYYGYRFYDSAIGRWTNRDPIAERGGANLNAFAANNSVNWVDCLGLEESFNAFPTFETEMAIGTRFPYTPSTSDVGDCAKKCDITSAGELAAQANDPDSCYMRCLESKSNEFAKREANRIWDEYVTPDIEVITCELQMLSGLGAFPSFVPPSTGRPAEKEEPPPAPPTTSGPGPSGSGPSGSGNTEEQSPTTPSEPSNVEVPPSKKPQFGACFLAGTLIENENGFQAIENVHLGDRVWTYDLEARVWALEPVEKLHIHEFKGNVCRLILDDGSSIEVTENHPFFVTSGEELKTRRYPTEIGANQACFTSDGRWVDAGSLKIGDVLKAHDKGNRVIVGLSKNSLTTKVYNITLAGNHNYCVSKSRVLVHNKADRLRKIKRPGLSRKEASSEKPSWLRRPPYVDETPTDYAENSMNEQYGEGGWDKNDTGGGSEYSQIKKHWRGYMDP